MNPAANAGTQHEWVPPLMVRAASYLLAAIFLASGIAKLLALPFEIEAFTRWGYPTWFMYLTGILEVAGAIGLLVPRVSALAAFCLAGLMVGAVYTHVVNAEWPMLVLASGILALAAWRGWVGRHQLTLFQRSARVPE